MDDGRIVLFQIFTPGGDILIALNPENKFETGISMREQIKEVATDAVS